MRRCRGRCRWLPRARPQAALEWKKRPDRLADTAYFDLPIASAKKFRASSARDPKRSPSLAARARASRPSPRESTGSRAMKSSSGAANFRRTSPPGCATKKQGSCACGVVQPRGCLSPPDDYIAQIGPADAGRSQPASCDLTMARGSTPRASVRRAANSGMALLLDITQCAGWMPMNDPRVGRHDGRLQRI